MLECKNIYAEQGKIFITFIKEKIDFEKVKELLKENNHIMIVDGDKQILAVYDNYKYYGYSEYSEDEKEIIKFKLNVNTIEERMKNLEKENKMLSDTVEMIMTEIIPELTGIY